MKMRHDLSNKSHHPANGEQNAHDSVTENNGVVKDNKYTALTPLMPSSNSNGSDKINTSLVEANSSYLTAPYGTESYSESQLLYSTASATRAETSERRARSQVQNLKKNEVAANTKMSEQVALQSSTTALSSQTINNNNNNINNNNDDNNNDDDNNNITSTNNNGTNEGNMMFESLNDNKLKRTQRGRIAVDEDFNLTPVSLCERLKTLGSNLKRTLFLTRVLLKLTVIDLRERTCTYILGFCAVLVVVIVCVAMLSLLNSLPFAFLQLAEANEGQMDLKVVLGGLMSHAQSINYTRLTQIFPHGNNNTGRHAPRISFTTDFVNLFSCPSVQKQSELWYYPDGTRCMSSTCISTHCNTSNTVSLTVLAFDDALERAMGLGADFNYQTLKDNEVILSDRAATSLTDELENSLPSRIVLFGNLQKSIPYAFRDITSSTSRNAYTMTLLNVVATTGTNYQKFPETNPYVLVNYRTLIKMIGSGFAPWVPDKIRNEIVNTPVEECTNVVYFNMEGNTRRKAYQSTNYNVIRQRVTR